MEVSLMKISIIIPFHRGEGYLCDCLDSLKEQNTQDIEIILVCDHVQQEELRCLADYNLPIRVYYLQDKTGVAAARNLGLDKAKGDYVYFLDSDDYLYGNTIEELLAAAIAYDCDIIYGKKKASWFGRGVYLTRKQEQEAEKLKEDTEAKRMEQAEPQVRLENTDPGRIIDTKNELMQKEGTNGSSGENGGNTESSIKRRREQKEAEGDPEEKDESEDTDEIEDITEKEGIAFDTAWEESLEMTPEELLRQKEIRRNQAYRILVANRKGVRNISVLGILYKRSLLDENHLRFPENLIYFSDVPFLLEALSKAESFYHCSPATYIKRRHNDSINFPSLSQIRDPNRFYEFIDTYYETIKRIDETSVLKAYLDRKYISYYTRYYAPKLKRSKDNVWREENFLLMSDIIGQVNPEVLQTLRGYKKRVIRALLRKDIKASTRIVILHLARIKLKKMSRSRREFINFFYIHFFLKCTLKENWILFESFFGKNYSDSPKYIYEYLAKNYPGKYKFIWVIDNKRSKIPYRHRRIKRNRFLYSYYLARCKYYVFNGRQPEWVIKREGNVFLQTWHGTPLKKLVFDMEEITSATPQYKQQVYKQSRAWDYLIAPNAFSSETFRRCFMFEKCMLETGYPRNDILNAPDRDERARLIRKKLGIPQEKKTILYAPTWRDDEYYGKGRYKFELQLKLDLMREQLGEEYAIILRTHYFIADVIDVSGLKGFAYNLSKYDDISELYLISDLLITDYSSVFFDYANLKRPMLFFTYDLEKYRNILRGFYFDIEHEVPGPLLFTTEEVIDAIRHIDSIHREYKQRYEKFYQRFCEWEDGHATEKVVELVFEDIEESKAHNDRMGFFNNI
jgi:CDP-glycerol glycerophosphotransferase